MDFRWSSCCIRCSDKGVNREDKRRPARAFELGGETESPLGVEEAVEGGVSVTLLAEETGESDVVGLASEAAILVDLGDGELHRSVVLGVDHTVGSRALARDVQIDNLALIVLHFKGITRHTTARLE